MKWWLSLAGVLFSAQVFACPVLQGTYRCTVQYQKNAVDVEMKTTQLSGGNSRYWILETDIEASPVPVRRTIEGMGFYLVGTGLCDDQHVRYHLEQFNADTSARLGDLNLNLTVMSETEVQIEFLNSGEDTQWISCVKK